MTTTKPDVRLKVEAVLLGLLSLRLSLTVLVKGTIGIHRIRIRIRLRSPLIGVQVALSLQSPARAGGTRRTDVAPAATTSR